MTHVFTRRRVLRGAGVALALPWLESLSPRPPRAQAQQLPRRFLPIYLPNGAHEFWRPATSGRGDAWQLSSILEPFGAALKAKFNVVTNLENGSVFNTDGTAHVEPSHGRLGGAWLTCVDAAAVRRQLGLDEANGISVDQVLAQHDGFKGKTALASLQVGLSTPFSSCDGEPCSSSRSVSWASARSPCTSSSIRSRSSSRIVGVARTARTPTRRRRDRSAKTPGARNKSVLDAVLENAQRTRARLGASDQLRMDEFLDSGARGRAPRRRRLRRHGRRWPAPFRPAYDDAARRAVGVGAPPDHRDLRQGPATPTP